MLQISIYTEEGKCKSGTCRSIPEAPAGAESQVEKAWNRVCEILVHQKRRRSPPPQTKRLSVLKKVHFTILA